MRKHPEIPRNPFRPRIYHGEDGQVFIAASGASGMRFSRAFRPTNDVIRQMLLEIRRRKGWSQTTMAAVLGVPNHSLRKWEEGDRNRNPSAAAARLIWMFHALVFEPNRLLGGLDYFVTWGAVDQEKSLVLDPEEFTSGDAEGADSHISAPGTSANGQIRP